MGLLPDEEPCSLHRSADGVRFHGKDFQYAPHEVFPVYEPEAQCQRASLAGEILFGFK